MKLRAFKETDANEVSILSNNNSEVFQYPKVTPDFLKRMVAHPKYKMFVLMGGRQLIGFCGLNFSQLPICELGPLAVEQGRRKQGIGRFLVESVFDFARGIHAKKVIIKVKPSNTGAQDFFKALGVSQVGKTMCAESPALLMEKDLD